MDECYTPDLIIFNHILLKNLGTRLAKLSAVAYLESIHARCLACLTLISGNMFIVLRCTQ